MFWGVVFNLFLGQTEHTDRLMPILILQLELQMTSTLSTCLCFNYVPEEGGINKEGINKK
jgi:hypothetical protein